MYPLPGLKAARARRLLSQDELALRAGIAKASISRIEHGQPARGSTIRKLAAALEVEPAELMKESDAGQLEAAA